MMSFKFALIWSLAMIFGSIVIVALASFALWKNAFAMLDWGFVRYIGGLCFLAFSYAATCKIYQLIKSRQQKVKS